MSTSLPMLLLCVLFAFIAGSIPFGWILARLKGIDLTQVGSGNIGATNATRALGKAAGALVLFLDASKGFFPVWLARRYGLAASELPFDGASPAIVGVAAICGHVFSPWMGWKGGKGVATSLGVFLALSPLSAGIACLAFLVCFAVFRIASIGSLVASLVLVVTMVVRHEAVGSIIAVVATFVIVVVRHTDNIRRLWTRTETRL
ncbi:MAG: glycerol-3-phosphate 1-O-acyltransferase PlsY [Polyangia bacterium]